MTLSCFSCFFFFKLFAVIDFVRNKSSVIRTVFHSINKLLSVKHAIRNWRYKDEKDAGLSLRVATRAESLKEKRKLHYSSPWRSNIYLYYYSLISSAYLYIIVALNCLLTKEKFCLWRHECNFFNYFPLTCQGFVITVVCSLHKRKNKATKSTYDLTLRVHSLSATSFLWPWVLNPQDSSGGAGSHTWLFCFYWHS